MTYVKKGETYFLPYGLTDLQEPTIPVKVGDRVRIAMDMFLILILLLVFVRYHFMLVKIVEPINSLLAISR